MTYPDHFDNSFAVTDQILYFLRSKNIYVGQNSTCS